MIQCLGGNGIFVVGHRDSNGLDDQCDRPSVLTIPVAVANQE